ncbi:MAG: hypothetical protein KZQ58_12440 [gamma proteobacterium symbiont of Bathyaustriella thionipta]|nr:hypothetical protein [gamma proteobacterium symbiont of Bathyaustriella thionipta]
MNFKIIIFSLGFLLQGPLLAAKAAGGANQALPVWSVSKQSSGIKAWLYGENSTQNYRYIDPYAPIYSASPLSSSGWVTYLVKGDGKRDFIVKRANFKENGSPEVLGQLEGKRGEWRFKPQKGQTFSAFAYFLTSKGIILLRSDNVFTYLVDENARPHLLPEGWSVAWVQKGDIEGTRIVTLEKPLHPSLFDLGASTHTIGFYDIDKRRIRGTLDMTLGKGREAENFKNRFYLFDTRKGPLSIAIEDAYKHVTIRNIRSGQKRIIFERNDGISSLNAEQDSSGKIKVTASLGFSNKSIKDAEAFLYSGS